MPIWRSRLHTRLSPSEVQARLAALTIAPEDAHLGLPQRGGRPMDVAATADDGFEFVGTVSEHAFSLCRSWPHDKALPPELQGIVESSAGGSRIRLAQRLPWAPIVIVTGVVVAILFGPLALDAPVWPPPIESMIAIAVIALMMVGGVLKTAADTRRHLHALLEAAPTPSTPPRAPTAGR
jgi:hypothetical protein